MERLSSSPARPPALAPRRLGGRGLYRDLDVTREDQWISVVDGIMALRGRLDVLGNNAGIGITANIENATIEDFRRKQAVNIEGGLFGCKHAVRVMKGRGVGLNINVSSIPALF